MFLPVELIENNGTELEKCIIKYAKLWNLESGFINFVENKCSFCNTLVDRIVTGKAEYKNDNCAVACEPYASWLAEADEKAKNIIPFEKVDMGFKFVESIIPYRERKVKILNGVHTMSVLAAYNAGFTIVRDMVNDDFNSFASGVLERFNNPFIDHKLLDISLNSVAKFKARCLCSILDYYKKFGKTPNVLSFAFAALINFYEDYQNKDYPVNDVESVMEFFDAKHENIVFDTLSNIDFWGEDLTNIDNLYEKVKAHFDNIKNLGIKKALEILVNE